MTYRVRLTGAIWAALTAAALGAQGGTPPPDQGSSQPPVFRSGVEAVQVDVFVTDEHDNPVADLTRDDFEVFENDQPQVITTFAPVSIPVERTGPLPFGAEPDVQTNNRAVGHVYIFILAGTTDEVRTAYPSPDAEVPRRALRGQRHRRGRHGTDLPGRSPGLHQQPPPPAERRRPVRGRPSGRGGADQPHGGGVEDSRRPEVSRLVRRVPASMRSRSSTTTGASCR